MAEPISGAIPDAALFSSAVPPSDDTITPGVPSELSGYENLRRDFEPFAELLRTYVQSETRDKNPLLNMDDLLDDTKRMEAFRKATLFEDISGSVKVEGKEKKNKHYTQKRSEDDRVFSFMPLGKTSPPEMRIYQDSEGKMYKGIVVAWFNEQEKTLIESDVVKNFIPGDEKYLNEFARRIYVIPEFGMEGGISERGSDPTQDYYLYIGNSPKEGIDGKRYYYESSTAGQTAFVVEEARLSSDSSETPEDILKDSPPDPDLSSLY